MNFSNQPRLYVSVPLTGPSPFCCFASTFSCCRAFAFFMMSAPLMVSPSCLRSAIQSIRFFSVDESKTLRPPPLSRRRWAPVLLESRRSLSCIFFFFQSRTLLRDTLYLRPAAWMELCSAYRTTSSLKSTVYEHTFSPIKDKRKTFSETFNQ